MPFFNVLTVEPVTGGVKIGNFGPNLGVTAHFTNAESQPAAQALTATPETIIRTRSVMLRP